MLPEARRETLQAWPYEWRGVGGLLGDGIECQWGITYSVRTQVWYTGSVTQKHLRKPPVVMGSSWGREKSYKYSLSFVSPTYFQATESLDFRLRFIVYFSPRILGLFSQTSGDQYFHWMNPSYTIDTTFPGGSLEIFLKCDLTRNRGKCFWLWVYGP